jgi:hypothetical protein
MTGRTKLKDSGVKVSFSVENVNVVLFICFIFVSIELIIVFVGGKAPSSNLA